MAAARESARGFHFGYDSQDEWLRADLRVARAAEALGDTAAAIAAYSAYVDRWREGDAGLPELSQARRKLEVLRRAR